MIIKDEYTKILLDFEDPNDPWKDQCGNKWQVIGNPEVIYEKEKTDNININERVACFTTTRSYLLLEQDLEFGGDLDFTIDGWAYIDPRTPQYGRIFDFRKVNSVINSHRFELCRVGGTYSIQCLSSEIVDFRYIVPGFIGEWFHFALVWAHKINKLILYIHGKKQFENSPNFPRTIFKYMYVGSTDPQYQPNDTQLIGKIAWFRVSTIARWTEDTYDVYQKYTVPFDTKRIVLKNIELSNDTERRIKTWNNNIYVFVTSDKHKLIENSKTQKQMLLSS